MFALMSEILPTRIFEPKPPVPDGHRKAMHDSPKAVIENPITLTMLRLRNWRRVTPIVSGSGGTHGTGVVGVVVTTSLDGTTSSRLAVRSTLAPGERRLVGHRLVAAAVALARLPAEPAGGGVGLAPAHRAQQHDGREREEHQDDAAILRIRS